MIVKCEQCQTKFKIPDEKVTEKGVKVRCTKCQHTFRVKRSGADAVAADVTQPGGAPSSLGARPPESSITRKRVVLTQGQDVRPDLLDQPTRVAPVRQSLLQAQSKTVPGAPAPKLAGPAAATDRFSFDPSNPFGGAERTEKEPVGRPAPPPPAPAEAFDFDAQPAADPFGFDVPSQAMPPSATAAAEADPFDIDVPPAADPFAQADAADPAPTTSPGLGPSSVSLDSLFTDDPSSELTQNQAPNLPAEPDRGLFDIPPPPPAAVPLGGDHPANRAVITTPLARLSLAQVLVERPSGRAQDVGMEEAPPKSAARRALGLLVNLVIAGALVLGLATVGNVYVNDGKLDPGALSFERMKGLWARRDWVAQDVSNGLYETKAGRSVFFVRGEVGNRSGHSAHAKVRAEILDGTQVIEAAETMVGATASPEELYSLASPQDASALSDRLDKASVEISPGRHAPFLVTFYDYPRDLADLRLKVTVKAVNVSSTAAR